MFKKFTQKQLDNVQIDYALVFANYGEVDAKRLGPINGGAEFTATANIRDIEHDEARGKTMGLQVIDEINAQLTFSILDTSLETLGMMLKGAEYDEVNKIIKGGKMGVIPRSKYLKNITMFAKTVNGQFKKITLYHAMNEGDFTINAQAKNQGSVPLEIHAHWDALEDSEDFNLYTIEDVTSLDPVA